MAKAAANGIQIEYETTGDPHDRPLLLIIGLADQLIHWDDALCEDLAGRGLYVIRFDNRDSGLSTKCDGLHPHPSARDRRLLRLTALTIWPTTRSAFSMPWASVGPICAAPPWAA
jgi:pimeloyl-ACP methyl ester carboxylesterase